jgi:exosortase A
MLAGLSLTGVLVLILALYRDTTLYLGGLWFRFEDGPYGHGYLVLAISLYLLYLRRRKILALFPCPDYRAVVAVAASVLVWMAADVVDILVLQAIVLLPLVLSVAWAVAGPHVARMVLFPVLFIVFALPVWSPLLPTLRALTAAGAYFLVRLSDITAYMEDYMVQLPAGQLSIEAACSGLNYLLAALTLGVFYAWRNYHSFRARLLVIVVAAGAALLANILRVFVIIYLAYRTEMQHPLVRDHLMLGWYLFGVLVLALLLLDYLLYRRRGVWPDAERGANRPAGRAGCSRGPLAHSLLLCVVVVLVVSGPAAAWWLQQGTVAVPAASLDAPPGRSGWSGPVSLNDSWQPVYHGASQLHCGYHKQGQRVLLYVAYYPVQRQDSELINELNSISGPEWRQTAERHVISASGARVTEAELVSAGNPRRIVWYRYRIAGRYTTNAYTAKALQVLALLVGRRDAAVVALAADAGDDVAGAREGLDDFLVAMGPALERLADGRPDERGGS